MDYRLIGGAPLDSARGIVLEEKHPSVCGTMCINFRCISCRLCCYTRTMSRRVTVTLAEAEESSVSIFSNPRRSEHAALTSWAAQHGFAGLGSEASVIRALVQAGAEALREDALDRAYAEVAASASQAERDENRAIRSRYVERTERFAPE